MGLWQKTDEGNSNREIYFFKFIIIHYLPSTHRLRKRVSHLDGYLLKLYLFLISSSHLTLLYLVTLMLSGTG